MNKHDLQKGIFPVLFLRYSRELHNNLSPMLQITSLCRHNLLCCTSHIPISLIPHSQIHNPNFVLLQRNSRRCSSEASFTNTSNDSPAHLLNPTPNTQIQKLVTNLNLKSPHDARIHLRLQHHLRPLGKLALHRLAHRRRLSLVERIRRDDGRLDLPALRLHLLHVRIGDAHDGVETRIAGQRGHEIEGDGRGLALEKLLYLLRLEVAADEGIFEEGCELLGVFGGCLDGEELGFDLFEGVGFGGGDVSGVGVTGVEAVEVEGGTVGGLRGHGAADGRRGRRAEEGDVG
mmetsp:Transcript_28335/g.53482  ORF Transcript_28335/g.53482 Transcript_28335/m.53482 type:complete len:289 (-) Transcript_28335:116-982(-)